jgi:hypothetical protein
MTTRNRLAVRAESDSSLSPPKDEAERRKFWIDRGNRIVWGLEPTKKYGLLPPQTHLHWVCVNGNYSIEPRR